MSKLTSGKNFQNFLKFLKKKIETKKKITFFF
jgi:hypothetical protein